MWETLSIHLNFSPVTQDVESVVSFPAPDITLGKIQKPELPPMQMCV